MTHERCLETTEDVSDILCLLTPGHAGEHTSDMFDTRVKQPIGDLVRTRVQRPCRAELKKHLAYADVTDYSTCVREADHGLDHRDKFGNSWSITFPSTCVPGVNPFAPAGETRPQCPAVLHMSAFEGPYPCHLVPGHEGSHADMDGDTWDITYVDEPGVSPQAIPVDIRVRPTQDQLTALTERVGLLEAALTPAQPPENEAVLIDPVELGKLLEAQEKLNALEAAGVDNWEGYGHARQIMRERSNN